MADSDRLKFENELLKQTLRDLAYAYEAAYWLGRPDRDERLLKNAMELSGSGDQEGF
jgi:hypothetical protein